MKRWVIFSILFFFLYLLTLCHAYADGPPQLQIVSPTDEQTIFGTQITVSFIAGNMIFGKDGHIHLWLDATVVEESTATEIPAHAEYVLSDLPTGKHSLTLEIVQPDHTSFTPPIVQTSTFIVSTPSAEERYQVYTPQAYLWINKHLQQISVGIGAILCIILGIIIAKKFL
jgi:hypothetical protein